MTKGLIEIRGFLKDGDIDNPKVLISTPNNKVLSFQNIPSNITAIVYLNHNLSPLLRRNGVTPW